MVPTGVGVVGVIIITITITTTTIIIIIIIIIIIVIVIVISSSRSRTAGCLHRDCQFTNNFVSPNGFNSGCGGAVLIQGDVAATFSG
jgi:hypothetical protein